MLSGIPLSQRIVLGGDLNGYVGETRGEFERVHGGFGYGSRNQGREDIFRRCVVADMDIVNSHFKKNPKI